MASTREQRLRRVTATPFSRRVDSSPRPVENVSPTGPIRNRGHEHGRIIRLAVLESEQEIEAHSLIVARLSVLTTSVVCTEVCITRALPGIGDTSDPHR